MPLVARYQLVSESSTNSDACTVLSTEEIRTALGRGNLGEARPSPASGGYTDCRFPGGGAGDFRVTLTSHQKSAVADFKAAPAILEQEGKNIQAIANVGDGAYYWEDRLQFRVGDRIVTIWVNRTPRTEAADAVKNALTLLAKLAAERLSTSPAK